MLKLLCVLLEASRWRVQRFNMVQTAMKAVALFFVLLVLPEVYDWLYTVADLTLANSAMLIAWTPAIS